MNFRKNGIKTHFVTIGITAAIPIDTTIRHLISHPKLILSLLPKSLPKSLIIL